VHQRQRQTAQRAHQLHGAGGRRIHAQQLQRLRLAQRRQLDLAALAGRLQQRAVARGHHHVARLGQRRQLRPAHVVGVVQHHKLGAAEVAKERAQILDGMGGVRPDAQLGRDGHAALLQRVDADPHAQIVQLLVAVQVVQHQLRLALMEVCANVSEAVAAAAQSPTVPPSPQTTTVRLRVSSSSADASCASASGRDT
jgi:hypothetical protein